MSELSKKAIEAGIIPQQAVRLMQFWRSLPEDMPEHELQSLTEVAILEQLGEIEALLEKESVLPEMRETDLDLSRTFMENRNGHQVQVTKTLTFSVYCAYIESLNSVVFALSELDQRHAATVTAVGNVVFVGDVRYAIVDAEIRYLGEIPEYVVCRVRRLEHADVSNV